MNPGYRIEVFWSDEDQVWIADVPDLPMCSAHGLTPHEAVAEVLCTPVSGTAGGIEPPAHLQLTSERADRGRVDTRQTDNDAAP